MLKVAWRSILRNRRRSLLSLLIIIFGVTVLFLVKGYIAATYDGLKMISISRNGHFQIARRGYWGNQGKKESLLSKEETGFIKEVLEEEEITNYTTRLKLSGLIGTENGSVIVSGTGIEPGSSQNQNIMIEKGTNLFAGDRNRVLLGRGIMQEMGLEIGEWVSIMATTTGGAYNADNLLVTGSFTTGNNEADSHYIYLPIDSVRNILNTGGIDKFIVRINDTGKTSRVISRLKSRFEGSGLEVEIKSWLDLADMYHQVKGLYDTIFFFLSLVIFMLVFFSILEIMSMAFFERIKEIGTIRAVGTSRSQVFIQLLEEAIILGITGGIVGIAAGWTAGYFLNQLNISYTPPNMSSPVPLYFELVLADGFIPLIIVLISTAFSAFYPAFKASRTKIVEMLRYN